MMQLWDGPISCRAIRPFSRSYWLIFLFTPEALTSASIDSNQIGAIIPVKIT
jgi:hypothetical protein